MKNEEPAEWKKLWRTAFITAAVVFFLLAWLLPLDQLSFFVLFISGFVHTFTIAIFLIRRLKTPTNVDVFMVKFGLIIFALITFATFTIADHAIPE
ncbi:hypothetical protein OAK43_02195 [Verrucomicrobiales bacterium]|nr:hypothetical protein [Verrucomicrobiales bacterium]MDC0275917.1 hypothetical protein [Verrucomicrobiales bacterium]MDC0322337.1 hypothetical protein [Verrucomicrobiales bacterium]